MKKKTSRYDLDSAVEANIKRDEANKKIWDEAQTEMDSGAQVSKNNRWCHVHLKIAAQFQLTSYISVPLVKFYYFQAELIIRRYVFHGSKVHVESAWILLTLEHSLQRFICFGLPSADLDGCDSAQGYQLPAIYGQIIQRSELNPLHLPWSLHDPRSTECRSKLAIFLH